jgi:hypothetical protein
MMNGNSDHKQEGVHQRTMSAEESDEHQALPLLDPNAVIRPLEMDLHGVCVCVLYNSVL